jgi:hypothetical protein
VPSISLARHPYLSLHVHLLPGLGLLLHPPAESLNNVQPLYILRGK